MSNVSRDDGMTGPEHEVGSIAQKPLWQELRAAIGTADPIPPEVLRAARESFTWRTIDAELAALAYDSVIDRPTSNVTRGSEGPRMLTFEAPQLTVELEVTTQGSRRQLVGQLIPPRRARVAVRHHGGTALVEADELGRFSAGDLPRGPSSLRCHLSGSEGTPIVTDWVAL
jgi:hypothetical protein